MACLLRPLFVSILVVAGLSIDFLAGMNASSGTIALVTSLWKSPRDFNNLPFPNVTAGLVQDVHVEP